MHAAGSLAAVVVGPELGAAVVEVVALDFVCFEPESSEHAARSAPVTRRAISGEVRRRGLCIGARARE
jgi:hypothetical protein